MNKTYQYFHNILISYFQGTLTQNEIKNLDDLPFTINKLSQWSDFLSDFEESFRDYDEDLYFEWIEYKEYAKDTAPTIKGLSHSLEEFIKHNILEDEFIEWACWHNGDCGETTSGIFENNSIEFFCLYFIPERYKSLEFSFYEKVIPLIKRSIDISYGEFIIKLYLLVEKERKSLYFFLKEYINGSKSEEDLEKYFIKKFNRNLDRFKFDLSKFPYKEELNRYKKEGLSIDDFIKVMENKIFIKGKAIQISVNEPYEWSEGELLGIVEEDLDAKKLKVRLNKNIKGKNLSSDFLLLSPRYENEDFSKLLQNKSVTAGGALIKDNSDEFEYILIADIMLYNE